MSPNGAPEIPSEGSLRGSFVAMITPFFAIAAGWVASLVAEYFPGVNLDQNQIIAFMIAASTSTLTAGYKWVQGWQQHEQRVSEERAIPIKQATPGEG